jgi:hypothetical protein
VIRADLGVGRFAEIVNHPPGRDSGRTSPSVVGVKVQDGVVVQICAIARCARSNVSPRPSPHARSGIDSGPVEAHLSDEVRKGDVSWLGNRRPRRLGEDLRSPRPFLDTRPTKRAEQRCPAEERTREATVPEPIAAGYRPPAAFDARSAPRSSFTTSHSSTHDPPSEPSSAAQRKSGRGRQPSRNLSQRAHAPSQRATEPA